ncbi:MAG: mechanosensitive ion channel protein MscS [Hydrocarboniphaga sp.]|uniref:mechanosensitive ion channel family protein n=1 Tax=Hydrocarboniphaga sp. TaxID=2033016 RepID=UPI00261B0374|nr:mechanosensitive ion channel domain-containing protein [Hydrocarboniphaga sp.]MDB5968528.1 mechanosensitive ion channel protein MscS [Hydrocarboniphaga sp.]
MELGCDEGVDYCQIGTMHAPLCCPLSRMDSRLNQLLETTLSLLKEAPPWVWTGLIAAGALLAVIVLMRLFRWITRRTTSSDTTLGMIARRTNSPLTAAVALLALNLVFQAASDQLIFIAQVRHGAGVLWIGAVTWLLLRSVSVAGATIVKLNPFDAADNLRARSVLTQARVLTRTLNFLILLVGVSIALMTFPEVRQIGTSLLASAGIAGLAVGLAAKPVLGNLLAGLQIALTQPIRIDDVLVIEGEWGRVEEITGTYIVVAIWDQRRLVVPLQYFIEKPFQNWTRKTSQILGTVMLWVDYRLPVEPIRVETTRLCELDKDWDGRVGIVQVTDTSETTMQLRVLLSSADSGRNFDLRCRVREGLIAFIAREYPLHLPHLRAELMQAETPPAAEPTTARRPGDQAVSPTPTAPQSA